MVLREVSFFFSAIGRKVLVDNGMRLDNRWLVRGVVCSVVSFRRIMTLLWKLFYSPHIELHLFLAPTRTTSTYDIYHNLRALDALSQEC